MIRKYNFLIFTLIFCILFGLVFFTGYNRKDANSEMGKAKTEQTLGDATPAASINPGECSNCNCNK